MTIRTSIVAMIHYGSYWPSGLKFKYGQKVTIGTVIGWALTKGGQIQYVVEIEGMTYTLNEDQLSNEYGNPSL